MKKFATIESQVNNLGFGFQLITFDNSSIGFDIYSIKTGYILCTVQPVHYSNGDRWLIKDRTNDLNPSYYRKNLHGFIKELKKNLKDIRTGFIAGYFNLERKRHAN